MAMTNDPNDDMSAPDAGTEAAPARRQLLQLGAAAAASVVTVRPALAQTANSVLNCQIPVPDPARANQYIAANGRLVPAGTKGAFPPSPRAFTGEEIKKALRSNLTPPGVDREAFQAYLNYIRRLRAGTSGFTCYASLIATR